jgi:hypothetical protein
MSLGLARWWWPQYVLGNNTETWGHTLIADQPTHTYMSRNHNHMLPLDLWHGFKNEGMYLQSKRGGVGVGGWARRAAWYDESKGNTPHS